jgi:hypothetical protein
MNNDHSCVSGGAKNILESKVKGPNLIVGGCGGVRGWQVLPEMYEWRGNACERGDDVAVYGRVRRTAYTQK